MKNSVLISIFCEDQTGLVANITSRLFDLGINLGDTNFAVLGSGAEFTSVCEIPQNITLDVLKNELKEIDHLVNARIDIQPFTLETTQGSGSKITHTITISGGDQPALIARICETLIEYGTKLNPFIPWDNRLEIQPINNKHRKNPLKKFPVILRFVKFKP